MTDTAPTFRLHSRLAPFIERWTGIASVLEKGVGAFLDLAIRLWLAKIFFVSGVLKSVNWEVTIFLYANEHPVPGLAPETAALIGTGIELVCPILLVAGLATRFATVPLLLTTAFLQFTYKDLSDHLYWMALLGFLLFRGPGALSIDHFIAPHLAGSAIPFGSVLGRIAALKEKFLLPPFDLIVRLMVAWLFWRYAFSTALSALSVTGLGVNGFLVLGCILLVLGFATRVAALILAVLSTFVFADVPALGDPVLRVFLLATFVVFGPSLLSIDHLVERQLRRLCPSLSGDPSWLTGAPRVVIVGAGFGGL